MPLIKCLHKDDKIVCNGNLWKDLENSSRLATFLGQLHVKCDKCDRRYVIFANDETMSTE
jgi:hypothetical protein